MGKPFNLMGMSDGVLKEKGSVRPQVEPGRYGETVDPRLGWGSRLGWGWQMKSAGVD